MNTDWNDLIQRYIAGHTTAEETHRLETALKADDALADLYLRHMELDVALEASAASAEATRELLTAAILPETRHGFAWLSWRPLAAAAAGLVIGLFSASIVWATSTPRVSKERLFSLQNGNFDEKGLERGFPRQTRRWSGDEAAITNDERLSFVSPGGDSNDRSARAISCDVFQLVDLRPLRHSPRQDGDAVLELSANFLDARPYNTNPSITFFCQLYLFQGDPMTLHQTWPQCIADALASGSAQLTTLGSLSTDWKPITAKCLVPTEADFAVIQIAARPNLRPAKLQGLFVDDVKLTLKTSPELPIRIVQR
ncbi:MAG: hypothetical protein ACKVY0_03775 [Prosthecobacter sp.]|uniref:hypothetical protein n=1 Tax=Prosthecobacter sp. TaxID=1965333 RepID=UPI0038FE655F